MKHRSFHFHSDCTVRKRTKATLHLSTHPSTAGLRKDNGESPGEARTTHRPASPWTHSGAQTHSFRGCRGCSRVQPTHIKNGQAAARWQWPPALPRHNPFPPCGRFLSLLYASITPTSTPCQCKLVIPVSKLYNGSSWCVLFCVWLSVPTLVCEVHLCRYVWLWLVHFHCRIAIRYIHSL